MEPATGLTILGTAVGSAKVIEKILGPTADYIGAGVRNWTERRTANVANVFRKAANCLGDRIERPGSVPPKVLKNVLEEAAFSEDELTAEYFGGVLASSRSEVSRDDRGAAFAALVGRLTSYQIRAHYFFYTVLQQVYAGSGATLGGHEARRNCELFVPMQSYATAMEFSEKEDLWTILSHTIWGLIREGLLLNEFEMGNLEHIRSHYPGADQPGILLIPSFLGAELYLWAHGRGDLHPSVIFDRELKLSTGVKITTAPGIRSTHMADRGLPPPEPTSGQGKEPNTNR